MSVIGINAWVWTSPVNTDELAKLAPHVAAMGFDLIEVPIESTTDLDYTTAASIVRDAGLAVSVCAAMGPDRDLIHPDEGIRNNGMAYIRHCIEAAGTLGARNLIGPLYSAVGRCWQATPDERARDTDLLVAQLRELAAHAGEHGVTLGLEPLKPVRDQLHQPGGAGDRGRRSCGPSGPRSPARHLPHEYRGALDRRRDSSRGSEAAASARVRKRPGRGRLRARAVARGSRTPVARSASTVRS